MRIFLTVFFFYSIGLFSQDTEKMRQIFPEKLDAFAASEEAQTKILKDGTIRVFRDYLSAERKLTLKLSASSDENLDKNLADIGALMNRIDEMAEQELIQVERDQAAHYAGIFTFISREQGVSGGLFLVKDRYMLEIEIIGGQSIEEAKNVLSLLDFSTL